MIDSRSKNTDKPTPQIIDAQLLAQMRALRESILVERGGEMLSGDLLDIMEQLRAERDEELARGLLLEL